MRIDELLALRGRFCRSCWQCGLFQRLTNPLELAGTTNSAKQPLRWLV